MECPAPSVNSSIPSENHRLRRGPPKSLIIVIENILCALQRPAREDDPASTSGHSEDEPLCANEIITSLSNYRQCALHRVAREGCCGVLAASEKNDCWSGPQAKNEDVRPLLDQIFVSTSAGETSAQSLRDRFQGIQSSLFLVNPCNGSLKKTARTRCVDVFGQYKVFDASVLPKTLAIEVSKALNIEHNTDSRTSMDTSGDERTQQADMLVVSMDAAAGQAKEDDAFESACCAVAWLDDFVSFLEQIPGFRDCVILSIVLGGNRQYSIPFLVDYVQKRSIPEELMLSCQNKKTEGKDTDGVNRFNKEKRPYDSQIKDDDGISRCNASEFVGETDRFAAPPRKHPKDPSPHQFSSRSIRRPRQSFQFIGIDRISVDPLLSSIVIHRLQGTIRCDRVARLKLSDVIQRGGGGCILAQHMLHEISYKIGRSSKYGD